MSVSTGGGRDSLPTDFSYHGVKVIRFYCRVERHAFCFAFSECP